MTFLRTFRGALLVISHDLALLDQAITRILHLDDGELIEYRGTYSQYLVARKEDEARRAKLATRQESEIVRLKSLADVDAPADAEPGPHRQVARHARRADAARAGAHGQGRAHAQGEAARAAARGQGRARGRGPRQSVRAEGRVRRRDLRRRPGRTPARVGPQRRGQDDVAAVAGGRDGTRAGHGAARPPGVDRLLRAGTRGHPRGPDRHGARAGGVGARPTSTCAACSACSDCAGTSSSRMRARSPAARRPSSRSRCSSPSSHNLLLLDEPTNNLDPPSRVAVGGALRDWKGAMVIVSHDTEFVTELAPDRVLLMPEGVLDYWSDELLDLVALACEDYRSTRWLAGVSRSAVAARAWSSRVSGRTWHSMNSRPSSRRPSSSGSRSPSIDRALRREQRGPGFGRHRLHPREHRVDEAGRGKDGLDETDAQCFGRVDDAAPTRPVPRPGPRRSGGGDVACRPRRE